MKLFEKIVVGLVGITLCYSVVSSIIIMSSLGSLHAVPTDSQENSSVADTESTVTEDTESNTTEDEINLEDYVTYFDLAYAAYTNPTKFLDKEITLVGYYSNSALTEEEHTNENTESDAESEATESESDSSSVYHFITTYGQVDECHITAEFTTADGKYPEEIGTVIKITGKFTAYEEDGNTYYTIAADTYSTLDA